MGDNVFKNAKGAIRCNRSRLIRPLEQRAKVRRGFSRRPAYQEPRCSGT